MVESSDEQQPQTASIQRLQDELRDLKLNIAANIGWGSRNPRMKFYNMETDYISSESLLENTDFSDIVSSQENEKEYLLMNRITRDDFNAGSSSFDGLKTLRQMNRDADEAIVRAAVLLEDTDRFLASRNLKPAR